MIDNAVSKLAAYALQTGLIEENESIWAVNTILDVLKLDSYTDPQENWGEIELAPVLEELLEDAHARGVLAENSVVYRDLFDSELMGRLTPASFQAGTNCPGTPAPVVTTCTPSSITTFAISGATGFISMMFTPKGLLVSSLHRRIC